MLKMRMPFWKNVCVCLDIPTKRPLFLNFVLMYFVERPDRISLSGLTAEKIGLNVLEAFFARKRDISRRSLCTLFTDFKNIWELSVRIDVRERLEKMQ